MKAFEPFLDAHLVDVQLFGTALRHAPSIINPLVRFASVTYIETYHIHFACVLAKWATSAIAGAVIATTVGAHALSGAVSGFLALYMLFICCLLRGCRLLLHPLPRGLRNKILHQSLFLFCVFDGRVQVFSSLHCLFF